MPGAELIINDRELQQLQRRLFGLAGADFGGLLDVIGSEVESQTRRRISDEKTGPDGEPWDPWSDGYAPTRHSGQSLLQSEGHLLDSIQPLVTGTERLEVGTNLLYGATHQFGRDGTPARPFLGLSPENSDDVEAVITDWISRYFSQFNLAAE